MVLFIARFIIAMLGSVYTILGVYMVGSGLLNEYLKRTFLPMLVLVGGPPPALFEEDNPDDPTNKDYIPMIAAGILLAAVGISFICNIP